MRSLRLSPFQHFHDPVRPVNGVHVFEASRFHGGAQQLAVLERDTSKLESVKAPFPRLHYKDAMKLLWQHIGDSAAIAFEHLGHPHEDRVRAWISVVEPGDLAPVQHVPH